MLATGPRHRAAIVACARWEAPSIAEWIGYHLRLGFDHIYLTCNDDDPLPFRAVLRGLPDDQRDRVSYRPFFGQGQQRTMYLDALPRARAESEWLCLLDADEFIVLKAWPTLPALLDEMDRQGLASLALNWLFYGHSGHALRPGTPVLTTYTRHARLVDPHTKHITRASCFEPERVERATFPFWHGLTDPHWTGYDRRNVLGDDAGRLLAAFPAVMDSYLADETRSARMIERAYVAHFAFKSADDFRLRVARGLGGNFGGQVKWQMLEQAGQRDNILAEMNAVEDRFLAERGVGVGR